MSSAKQNEVVELRRAAFCPVFDVVRVRKAGSAAGKAATPVAYLESTPHTKRNCARFSVDLRPASVAHARYSHDARVARDASGRFRGNSRSILELGAPGFLIQRERRLIHVEDDEVSFSGCSRMRP